LFPEFVLWSRIVFFRAGHQLKKDKGSFRGER